MASFSDHEMMGPESKLSILVSRIVAVSSSTSSSPIKHSVQDLKETRGNVSSLLMNKLRSCSCFPEETLTEEDLLILETFFDKYLNQIFLASFRSTSKTTTLSSTATLTVTTMDSGMKSISSAASVQESAIQSSLENNWKWVSSLMKELHDTLSGSMFMMNKCKHLILIPLMKSFHFLVNSPSTTFILHDKDVRLTVSSMKRLLILLLSFSVSPHEIQLFFSLISQHRSLLHQSWVASPKKSTSPVKSRSSSITVSPSKDSSLNRDTASGQKESKDEEECSEVSIQREEEEDIFQDNYFSVLTGSLSQPILSSLPSNFFAFTSYSCLSLPPVKSFPLKGFTFSTHIRLESLQAQIQSHNLLHPQTVHHQQQKQILCPKNDQRMFLFSFKSSSSPPFGFSAFFSQSSITTGSSNDSSSKEQSYVKLTVSCFKGSSCPSLSHTLSFPFPVFQAARHALPDSSPSSPSLSHRSAGNEFIQLSLTFSPTALCLYINGELIESNCNDWTIGGVKTPFPSFDRCLIGCPFVSQVKGNSSLQANPNDTGFRGQLTSIYLFSSVLSSSSIALLQSLEDVSNASPCFGVNPSVCPPTMMTAITKGTSIKNESDVIKCLREVNASLVCLYSPSSVNWPIVLQCVNGNTASTSLTLSSNSGRNGQFDITSYYHVQVQVPATSALTSHSLIQGNLEIVQRNLLIDSIQSLNQGLDMILDLLRQFIRETRVTEFSQLFSFTLDLMSNEKNHYFLEAAISSNFLKEVLSLLLCLPTPKDRCLFLSFPSLFLQSLISILQTMIQDKKLSETTTTTRRSSLSSSVLHRNAFHPKGLLQRCMTVKEIESLESETEKYKKMRIECVKQVLELFIFNSFLWSQLLLQETDLHYIQEQGDHPSGVCSKGPDTLVKSSRETNKEMAEMESKPHVTSSPSSGIRNDSGVSDMKEDGLYKSDTSLISNDNGCCSEKDREETLSSLYSFISTQLLSLPSSQGILLRRKRRSAFLLQVFNSLKNHFYHRKYPESFMMHDLSLVEEEEVIQKEKTSTSEHSLGNHEREFLKKLLSDKKTFDRRERMVSLIRSNILVFIKSLLTKGSSVSASQSGGTSSSTSSSSTSSSSTTTAATTGTTVELLDANDNQSESGGKMMTGSTSSSSDRTRIPDHQSSSPASNSNESRSASLTGNSTTSNAERSSFLDDEDGYFEEETNCILNYLSVTSKEILQRENSCKKSLLNLIDVLSLLNSLLIEIPSSMIPAFDTRKGIYVLFQVMNNTIRSSVESESDAEEKEVIRSLCLKILGSFLMRSTYKRKSQSMTSSHFSILYYMLSRDRSILTHSLYVNLMEITIEAPISSLYSLQSSLLQNNRRRGENNTHVNQEKEDGSKDLSDDDYYWSSSCDGDRDGDGRPASSASLKEGSNSSASRSSIKIENPQMIKVIALLVVGNKRLANQFLKDLFTLLLDSRSNRRLILQMSVWQSWLISFLKIETQDDRERKKREQTVISVFKLLLYHALRWEFGGWRVWIDSLAIIHSFLSREAFNKTYQESLYSEQQAHRRSTQRTMSTSSGNNGHLPSEEEEEDKLEDERQVRREQQNHENQTQSQQQIPKKRLTTPTYRIPAFRWSSIHVQLLDSLLAAIITDINCFRKEAMMRANLNGSPTNLDSRESERDTNESLILESILMNSDIYVINIIHLISQLTDSCILDAGGLLPLLAVATSSSSSSSSTGNKRQTSSSTASRNKNTSSPESPASPDASSSTIVTTTTSNNSGGAQQTSLSSSCLRKKQSSKYEDDARLDLMNESKATDLLLQLVFLADYLIFNSTLTSNTGSSSSTGVSLAELEAEKNMSSGGLLRQILRLVSLVAVKRVLVLKDRETRKDVSRKTSVTQSSVGPTALSGNTTKNRESEEEDVTLKRTSETPDIMTVESDSKDSSSEIDESDDDLDSHDLNGGMDGICDSILITSCHPKGASKFLRRYLEDNDEENDHLMLSVKDIQRLRATVYRSDASTTSSSSAEKERTNSNFLALSTMYFLSVLLVSKYRDTLDVVSTGNKARSMSASSSNAKETESSQSDYKSSNFSNESDLATMEKSLYPTVQFLKEIISDFEAFLSKSLLGSKGQTLLTKQLVKRIKSSDCSPLEVVMLLCAQEFQNSLQKNAGLAFIELINEGRLLSLSMKEHVIRVGIEADFILSRIEREERDRDTLFKRESFLLEEKREKEVDLVQDVIATLSCPGVDVSSLLPDHHLSSSSLSRNNKYRSSKRKSFRDIEEFLSEKRMVLFKEDFMMQERESKCSSSSSSGSSLTMRGTTLPSGQPSMAGSIIDPATSGLRSTASLQTPSQSQSETVIHSNHREDVPARGIVVNGVSAHAVKDDQEVLVLKEKVKALMDRMEALEKERDHAMDELESLKQEKTKSASQSESESEQTEGPSNVSSRVTSSLMTTVSSASPRGDKKIGLDVAAFAQPPSTVDIISIEQTDADASGEEVIKIVTQEIVIKEDNQSIDAESNETKTVIHNDSPTAEETDKPDTEEEVSSHLSLKAEDDTKRRKETKEVVPELEVISETDVKQV